MSCDVGHRRGSDPSLLWLWHRLLATALTRPLAWELPCATGAVQKRQKKKKKTMLSLDLILHLVNVTSFSTLDHKNYVDNYIISLFTYLKVSDF